MDLSGARTELERRGIPFLQETFFRHVRGGTKDVVALFLLAGMSPDASVDGQSALAVATEAGHKEIAYRLLEAGANPTGLVDHFATAEKSGKDPWDKLTSLSGVFTFMASLLIASVGWYFTNAYNDRQLEWTKAQALREQEIKAYQNRVSELETVEKMIPHLAKDEASKRAALVAISVLATQELAAKFGEVYGGQGSLDALKQIATANPGPPAAPAVSALTSLAAQETSTGSSPARDALASVLQGKERSIVRVRVNNESFCNGFAIDAPGGWIVTAGYCLQFAERQPVFIQLWNGTQAAVRETRFTAGNLLALIRTDGAPLQALAISSLALRAGDTVTKLAFDLATKDPSRQLRVALGRIVAVVPTPYRGSSGIRLKVSLPPEDEQTRGTGGAPLFDNEGNVACMTFEATNDGMEACVAAQEIRDGLKAVTKT